MKPTMEILDKLRENSQKNQEEVFTRLFRYLLRSDLYYHAYRNLYANKGAATKGVNDDTADGFSEQKVEEIIERLKSQTYRPTPARRTYLKKSNGKLRPLGIPTFTDKLIQEVVRMVLEPIYEPVFSDASRGFRPNRSCHTALRGIKYSFPGVKWFIEGDIKGCFDNIHHETLLRCLEKKIKDARFLQLIALFLKAGYMEDWKYHNTYSGTPQGGILSPILANIYLNELDRFVEKFKSEFDQGATKRFNSEYRNMQAKACYYRKKIAQCEDEDRKKYMEKMYLAEKQLRKLPAKEQTDKSVRYIRYADDFLIGVKGSKMDCEVIKTQLSCFIRKELHMELSEEKTLITHSSECARFLGYDIRVRRSQQVKPMILNGKSITKRTLLNSVELLIPFEDKIIPFLFSRRIIEQKEDGQLKPCKRPPLLHLTDLEIVTAYNAELRGICNYYSMASNFNKLNYFGYLMEYSCLHTLADKHRSKISKVRRMFRNGKGDWCIPYQTKNGQKYMYFSKYRDCKEKECNDSISYKARDLAHYTSTFESRLKAKVCEICGATDHKEYEIHHVNKVKNLGGKKKWEQIMIAKRRKTLVLCHSCHMEIHHGSKEKNS